MKVARRAWLRALAIAPLAAVAPVRAQDPRASVVVNAARDWLALVDRGDIAASHARAGAKFRKAVSDKEWAALHERERRPRGAVTAARGCTRRNSTRGLPGVASEGEYAFAGVPDVVREPGRCARDRDAGARERWRVARRRLFHPLTRH